MANHPPLQRERAETLIYSNCARNDAQGEQRMGLDALPSATPGTGAQCGSIHPHTEQVGLVNVHAIGPPLASANDHGHIHHRFAWSVNGFYSFFWLVATNTQGTHIGQRDRHLINVP